MATYQRQRYLSPNGFYEASKEFGFLISKPKIMDALATGKLRGFQVGAHWRIPVEEINDYPDRMLVESRGLPTAHTGLLGNKVPKANN
jgi:excisionase family DNA binding protein